MDVTKYIKELLYRYECVVIPGFGAFLTRRKPARVHKTDRAFYPPRKILSFNRQLVENDGLLGNYISKAEGISYEQSLRKIHAFAQDLVEALGDHGEIRLDDIGSFYKRDGKILFQPALQVNYLTEAFGTSSFTPPVIERKTTADAPKTRASGSVEQDGKGKRKQTPKTEGREKTRKEPVPATADARIASKDEKAGTKGRPGYWKYAAVGIIAIGIGGYLGANWYSNQVRTHNLAAEQKAKQQVDSKIQEANFVMDAPLPEVKLKVKAERGRYHIVAGAFREKKNAEKKLEELKDTDFEPKYIGKNKFGLHQVIYDSYEDRKEALSVLRKIKEKKNPAAWLLVEEL